MIIPFTYNILKRHPALMVMIHRADVDALSGRHLVSSHLPRLNISLKKTISWTRKRTPCKLRHWTALYGSCFLILHIIMLQSRRCAKSSPRRLRNRDMPWKISWIILTIRYILFPSEDATSTTEVQIQLFDTEIDRKIKREPALAVGQTSKVFPNGKIQELTGGVDGLLAESTQRDFVGEFWAFG